MLKLKLNAVAALVMIAMSSPSLATGTVFVDATGDEIGLDLEKHGPGTTDVTIDGWQIETRINDFGGDLDVRAIGWGQENYVISAPCPPGMHRQVLFHLSGVNVGVPPCVSN